MLTVTYLTVCQFEQIVHWLVSYTQKNCGARTRPSVILLLIVITVCRPSVQANSDHAVLFSFFFSEFFISLLTVQRNIID